MTHTPPEERTMTETARPERLWAVIDPNWGAPVVLTTTIRETEAEAIIAAISTDERGANLYSGAALHCIPKQAGDWVKMQGFGYRTSEIRISIGGVEALTAELAQSRLVLAAQTAETQAVAAQRDHQRKNKDQAYEERNRLVAFLAGMFPSGIKRTDIPGWNPEWHGAVYIDFPHGQASWHFHDSQAHLFAHLPPYAGEWDGHTTEVKYANLTPASAVAALAERDRATWEAGREAAAKWHDEEAKASRGREAASNANHAFLTAMYHAQDARRHEEAAAATRAIQNPYGE